MGHIGDEAFLTRAASAALGTEIEAAGIFGLQDLMWAQMAGNTLGALGGDALAPDGAAALGAIGTVVGGRIAKEEAARALGMTLQLLVAVTEEHVVVLNWETGDHAGREVMRFARADARVSVTGFGLSRIVTIAAPDGGRDIRLHATTAPFRLQSKPDAAVLRALAV